MSLSCVVEHPYLASPGQYRTNLSQLGVVACVLGFCLHGFGSIASIELPVSLCLSFYSDMTLVLFCTMVQVRGRVGTVLAKGCSPTVAVSVLPS